MNLIKAIIKANKTSRIIKVPCHVVKLKTPVKWYVFSTWFRFENISEHYLINHNYKGKIYYSTKK